MTATHSDGGGADTAVLAGGRCSRRVPLRTAPPQPDPARDGSPSLSKSWGIGEGGGNGPPYCVSWAALRLDTFQVCLLNLTDQASAIQVSKPVVKYSIHSLRECGSAAYLGCSLCSVSGA